MPYKQPAPGEPQQCCDVCGPANTRTNGAYLVTDCSRSGDFQVDRGTPDIFPLPLLSDQKRALASHLIRRMQGSKRQPILGAEFFSSLSARTLPTPIEMSDNLLLLVAERTEGRPGKLISLDPSTDMSIAAFIGAVDTQDVLWAIRNVHEQQWAAGRRSPEQFLSGWLTASGWERVEELKRAHISSRYAFFARRFKNDDLDTLYEKCLKQAVAETGFELRIVTQKAGHIDAIVEDEIRRCRFLVADLSDANAGAYWEAGLAEGLRKDVIYICRDGVQTHFDTDHRQTVRWDLTKLDETAKRLKAVIRNTLLGDARQED